MAAQREIAAATGASPPPVLPLISRASGRGPASKTSAGQIVTGDYIAWRDLDGAMTTGLVTAVHAQRHGRLVSLQVRDSTGDTGEHLFSARTTVYRLPELPPDQPVIPPSGNQSGREYASLDRLRAGDTIEVYYGQPTTGVITAIEPVSLDFARLTVDLAVGGQPKVYEVSSMASGGVAVMRTGRGQLSADQPYDLLAPKENPQAIKPPDIRPGDYIRLENTNGRSVHEGTVTEVTTAEADDMGHVGLRVDLLERSGTAWNITAYIAWGSLRPEAGPAGKSASSRYATRSRKSRQIDPWQEDLQWDQLVTRLVPAAANPLAAFADPQAARRERIADGLWQTFRRVHQEILDGLASSALTVALGAQQHGENVRDAVLTWLRDTASGGTQHWYPSIGSVEGEVAGPLMVRTQYLLASAAQQMVPGGIDGRADLLNQAAKQLRPLESDMIRLATSQAIAAVEAAGSSPVAVTDAIQRLAQDPPLTAVAARALAEAAQQMAAQAPGMEAHISQPPPGASSFTGETIDLSRTMAGYRQALGDLSRIGQTYVRRALFEPPSLADLQQGRAPAMTVTSVWAPDTAPDMGPGAVTMGQNETVRAAGKVLHSEVDKRGREAILRITGTPWTADQIAAAKIQAKGERDRLIRQSEDLYDQANRAGNAARDAYSRQAGYLSWHDLTAKTDRYGINELPGAVQRLLAGGTSNPRLDLLAGGNVAYHKAYDPLAAQAREVTGRARAAYDSALRLDQQAAQARRDAVLSVLAEARGEPFGGVPLTYTAARGAAADKKALVEALRWAEQNYPASWLAAAQKHGTSSSWQGYTVSKTGRGDYNDAMRRIRLSDTGEPVIAGAPVAGRVATHELGHVMEASIPGLKALEQAELWRRTVTDPAAPVGHRMREPKLLMDGYVGEYGRRDQFPLAYSGKDYGDDNAELFTTGIESLLAGSPYLDTAFEEWMLGVLALLPGEGGAPFTGSTETQARAASTGNRVAVLP